jgi:hypothetical protein
MWFALCVLLEHITHENCGHAQLERILLQAHHAQLENILLLQGLQLLQIARLVLLERILLQWG